MNTPSPRPCARLLRLPGLVLAVLLAGAAVLPAVETAAGQKIKVPVPIKKIMPVHPVELQKKMTSGQAVVECLVSETGAVQSVKVVSASQPEFGAAAEAALRQWEFQPGEVDGVPAAVRLQIPFDFSLTVEQIIESALKRPVFQEINDLVIAAKELPAWPRPVKFLLPRYPDSLKGTGKYGKAVVSIIINKEGLVMNPTVIKATYPEFTLPALATAARLEFPPQVMADGKHIYVSMDIQFDFKPDVDKPPARKESKDKAKKS